ncbi:unnamed protein product [Macrosiphum euphorbiae]|uniref:Uncharacterized protein n=1 Tax=Macrosiphum euphorbiae TaxID=13131 RepID=A0AAV0W387_9HEMI|nr:unnamed protein product [Macrosiphum euphorbiae]
MVVHQRTSAAYIRLSCQTFRRIHRPLLTHRRRRRSRSSGLQASQTAIVIVANYKSSISRYCIGMINEAVTMTPVAAERPELGSVSSPSFCCSGSA